MDHLEQRVVLNADPVDDTFSTAYETAVNIAFSELTNNDAYAGTPVVSLGNMPSYGNLVDNGGMYTYTPNIGFSGTDSFTYWLNDDDQVSDWATVTVNVDSPPFNNSPYALDATFEHSIPYGGGGNSYDLSGYVPQAGTHYGDPDIGDSLTVTYNNPGVTPVYGGQQLNYSYLVDDGRGGQASANVYINIVEESPPPPTNNSPYANDANFELVIPWGSGGTWHDLSGFVPQQGTHYGDPDGDSLTVTYNAYGYGSVWPGTLSYPYYVDDLRGGTASAMVYINIVEESPPPQNQTPWANPGTYTADVYHNEAGRYIWVGGELYGDPDGDSLSISYDSVFVWAGSSNSANYTVTDPHGATASNTVSLTVNVLPNVDPTAVDDYVYPTEDVPLTFDPRTNDGDYEGDALGVTAISTPANGTAVLNGDGSITYTPAADFHGTDTFEYTLTDGYGGLATAMVYVVVSPVNDAPAATDDADLTVQEDTPFTIPIADLLANDADLDGDTVSFVQAYQPSHGTLVDNGDGTLTYTPAANYFGPDAFVYRITDGQGEFAEATVTLTVTGTDDPPVAVDDAVAVAVNTATDFTEADLTANDVELDGDPKTVVGLHGHPTHGSVTWHADGSFTYTPAAGYIGLDSFQYDMSDGTTESRATVRLEIGPLVTTAAGAVALATSEDTALDLKLTRDRLGGDLATHFRLSSTDGTFTVGGNPLTAETNVPYADLAAGFAFLPNLNVSGTLTFTVQAGTLVGGEFIPLTAATQQFSVAVAPVNDAPVATADAAYTVNEEEPLTVTAPGVLANDADVEGNALTAQLVAGQGPQHAASFTLNADGSFSYVPVADFVGTDTFQYQAGDGTALSEPVTVTITVNPVNDAPSFMKGDDIEAWTDDPFQIYDTWASNVTAGPTDEMSQELAFDVELGSTEEQALFSVLPQVDADGTLWFVGSGQVGTAHVTVTLHDDGGTALGGIDTSVPQQFTITFVDPMDSDGSEPPPPIVEFAENSRDVDVEENVSGGKAAFTLTLSEALDHAVSVAWATNAESAFGGIHYETTSGTASFAPGQTTAEIEISLINDTIEHDTFRTFQILLYGATGVNIGLHRLATATIEEDDVTATISDATAIEGNVDSEGNPIDLVFTVTLSRATDEEVTVNYSAEDITTSSGDYSGGTGSVTFAPGETSKQISLAVTNDSANSVDPNNSEYRRGEDSEYLKMNITAGSPNVMIGVPYGVGAIGDDDWQMWDVIDPYHRAFFQETYSGTEYAPGDIISLDPYCIDLNGGLTEFVVPENWIGGTFWESYIDPIYGWVETSPWEDSSPYVHLVALDTDPVMEGENAVARFQFQVTNNPNGLPVTIHYATHGLTGSAGNDFIAPPSNASVTITGDGTADVEVPVPVDGSHETLETFLLYVTSLSGASLTAAMFAQAAVNDSTPRLEIFNGQYDPDGNRIAVADAIKNSVGAFTVANLNDTDGDFRIDSEDSLVHEFSTDIVGQYAVTNQVELAATTGLRIDDTIFFHDLLKDAYAFSKITAIAGNVVHLAVPIDLTGLTKASLAGESEVDLMRLVVHAPQGAQPMEELFLEVPASIRIWNNSWKGDAAQDERVRNQQGMIAIKVEDIPIEGLVLWAEATTASQSLQDLVIRLHYGANKDEVRATALWISAPPVMLHNNGDQLWPEFLATPVGTGFQASLGGTGLRDGVALPGDVPGDFNAMVMQWTVGPPGIESIPGVQFDVARRRQTSGWHQFDTGMWSRVLKSIMPMDPERSNDDIGNGDETNLIQGKLYSEDSPGTRFPSANMRIKRIIQMVNFAESVRVSFDGNRPRGNNSIGSAVSAVFAWHSVLDIQLDPTTGAWVRVGGTGLQENERNHIDTGHILISASETPPGV